MVGNFHHCAEKNFSPKMVLGGGSGTGVQKLLRLAARPQRFGRDAKWLAQHSLSKEFCRAFRN
jgi:hypothetical protein